jgi:hypothetical protein
MAMKRSFNARNIKYEAGNAVAYGMSYDDALRAVTLTPRTLRIERSHRIAASRTRCEPRRVERRPI